MITERFPENESHRVTETLGQFTHIRWGYPQASLIDIRGELGINLSPIPKFVFSGVTWIDSHSVCHSRRGMEYLLLWSCRTQKNPDSSIESFHDLIFSRRVFYVLSPGDNWSVRHEDGKVKTYNCKLCSYETARSDHMRRHYTRMHDPDPVIHECPHCSYSAKLKDLLMKHLKHVHRDTI
jgi:hypothetical protein